MNLNQGPRPTASSVHRYPHGTQPQSGWWGTADEDVQSTWRRARAARPGRDWQGAKIRPLRIICAMLPVTEGDKVERNPAATMCTLWLATWSRSGNATMRKSKKDDASLSHEYVAPRAAARREKHSSTVEGARIEVGFAISSSWDFQGFTTTFKDRTAWRSFPAGCPTFDA